jgi:hypothetical protein
MIPRSIYGVFIALASFSVALAQGINIDKVTIDDIEWNEGTVTLTDGTKITGMLKLNTKTGLLAYENGATSRSFSPRNVLTFSYFDAAEKRQRNFLSVSYKRSKPKKDGLLTAMQTDRQKTNSEMGVPQFFEILVDCKTFALVTNIGRLSIRQVTGSYVTQPANGSIPATSAYTPPSTTYSQNEIILILSEDGTTDVVLDITYTEVDRLIFDSKNSKGKLDEAVIETYTAPFYKQLREYAKENSLKFKDRDDLIRIFEYYKTISAE